MHLTLFCPHRRRYNLHRSSVTLTRNCHLCRVAGSTVWSHYGMWVPVAVRLSSVNCLFAFTFVMHIHSCMRNLDLFRGKRMCRKSKNLQIWSKSAFSPDMRNRSRPNGFAKHLLGICCTIMWQKVNVYEIASWLKHFFVTCLETSNCILAY